MDPAEDYLFDDLPEETQMDPADDSLFDDYVDLPIQPSANQEVSDNNEMLPDLPASALDRHNFPDHQLEQLIDIERDSTRLSPKYGLTFDRYTLTVRDLSDVSAVDVPFFIHKLLDYVIRFTTSKAPPNARVRICIDAGSLQWPIWTPPIKNNQLTADRWMMEVIEYSGN